MRKYFYTDGINKFGPFSKEELKHHVFSRSTRIWYFGLEQWTELHKIDELKDLFSSIPPEISLPNNPSESKIEIKKNKDIENSKPFLFKAAQSNLKKWIFGIALLSFLAFITIKIIQKQNRVNLYNDIVTNSYDADENFDIYIDKFYRDLEFYGIFPKKPRIKTIKFSRLDQLDRTTDIHGLSLGYNDDNRIEIYINPSSWEQFTKPMRYYLIYHELAHDVLNLEDLEATYQNQGKLMYPEMSSFEKKTMDDFIESFHSLFEEEAKKQY